MLTVKAAQEMGRKAYESGKKRVPALDVYFMSALALEDHEFGYSVKYMKAWTKGWDYANLSETME